MGIRYIKIRNNKLTERKLFNLYFDSEGQCNYCGVFVREPGFNPLLAKGFDHVVPISKGGEHSIKNLVVCCLQCNSSKGNRTEYKPSAIAIWMRRRRMTVKRFCLETNMRTRKEKNSIVWWSAGYYLHKAFRKKVREKFGSIRGRIFEGKSIEGIHFLIPKCRRFKHR